MKSLSKYQSQLVLLVSLVIGYSQLFIPLTRTIEFSRPATSTQFKAQENNAGPGDIVYFEEGREDETDRFTRKQSEPVCFFLFDCSPSEPFQQPATFPAINRILSHSPSPYLAFRVLRL